MKLLANLLENFSFAEPVFLYLLVLPVALFLVWLLFVLVQLLSRPEQTYGSQYPLIGKIKLWGIFALPASVFMVIALAKPSISGDMIKPSRGDVEVIVLFDNSFSMKANDVKPSRLEIAKKEILNIRFVLEEGDKVGLFTFGKVSHRKFYLIGDFRAFFDKVSMVNFPESEGLAGDNTLFDTDLATALEHIYQSMDRQDASNAGYSRSQRQRYGPQKRSNRIVFVFSDGDDQFLNYKPIRPEDAQIIAEEKAEYVRKLAKMMTEYRKRGLKIYPVGVGTRKGVSWFSLLKDYKQGIDYPGDADFEKEWKVQITRLDRNNLSSLAKATAVDLSGYDWTLESSQSNVGSYVEYAINSNRRLSLELTAEENDRQIWQYCLLVSVVFLALGIVTYPFSGYMRK